jgi:uncharacterized membrane protein
MFYMVPKTSEKLEANTRTESNIDSFFSSDVYLSKFDCCALTATMTMLGIIGSVAGETLYNQSQVIKAEEQAET